LTIRKARKEAISKGYRSKFELDVSKWLDNEGIKYKYEPCQITYIVPESKHRYTPDWQINDDSIIYWESKGRLTAADRKKLLHIKASNPNLNVRILLQNSTVKISKKSKTSYSDWCEKNGFEWCDFRDKKKLRSWCK
jgi:hypothetical protein